MIKSKGKNQVKTICLINYKKILFGKVIIVFRVLGEVNHKRYNQRIFNTRDNWNQRSMGQRLDFAWKSLASLARFVGEGLFPCDCHAGTL